MDFIKGEGIVIHKNDVGEADRYISVFMEDFGKTSFLVKGIRKSKKRDKMAVDILALSEFIFYEKADRLILSQFNAKNIYSNIQNDIVKINIAYYFFIILNAILVENGRNYRLYNLLKNSLNFLDKNNDKLKLKLLVVYFMYNIIDEEGIAFECNKDKILLVNEDTIKLDDRSYTIIKALKNGEFKKIVADETYKLKEIDKVIGIFEKYLNANLDVAINTKNLFCWG